MLGLMWWDLPGIFLVMLIFVAWRLDRYFRFLDAGATYQALAWLVGYVVGLLCAIGLRRRKGLTEERERLYYYAGVLVACVLQFLGPFGGGAWIWGLGFGGLVVGYMGAQGLGVSPLGEKRRAALKRYDAWCGELLVDLVVSLPLTLAFAVLLGFVVAPRLMQWQDPALQTVLELGGFVLGAVVGAMVSRRADALLRRVARRLGRARTGV